MKNFLNLLALCLLFTLTTVLDAKAQTTYSFTYNASGNRTNRTIALLKNAHIGSPDSLAIQQKTFEDMIGQRKVKIYPNPTKGLLKVEIPFIESEPATVGIYTIQGALIKNQKVKATFTEIEFTNQPPGMYILRIIAGELSADWKIIKD